MLLVSEKQNNINFTSRIISPVIVRKVKYGCEIAQDAFLTELDHHNPVDVAAAKFEHRLYFDHASDEYNYYAIELPGVPIQERILALSDVIEDSEKLTLEWIESRYNYSQKKKRQYKGVGDALFSGICHLTWLHNKESLCFTSANNGFYSRIYQKAGILRKVFFTNENLGREECLRIAQQYERENGFSFLC